MDYADVLRLVEGGESENVEFKASTRQRARGAKALSAMLNGQGGYVLFGVQPDGKVVGQEVADKTLRNITSVCQESIYPAYPPSIERVRAPETSHLEVVAVSVPSGNMKPYAYNGDYFVRSGSSTVAMPPERQMGLVLERAHSFDRWETGESRRKLDAIDTDEVKLFRDEVIAGGRGWLDPRASALEILRSMNLLDTEGRPNRGAVALFGKPDLFGSEYTGLGCHLVAIDGTDLGEAFRDVQIVENNIFSSLHRAIDFCRDHLHRPLRLGNLQFEV